MKFSDHQFVIIQSDTLERSVNRAPHWPHESRDLVHFSIIDIKEQNLPWKLSYSGTSLEVCCNVSHFLVHWKQRIFEANFDYKFFDFNVFIFSSVTSCWVEESTPDTPKQIEQ